MQEIWKDVNGYNGIYQVSNLGNVRSTNHYDKNGRNRIAGRILKPGVKENGYLQIRLSDKDGKLKNHYVHRLVMFAFVGECPAGCEVNHIDENKANNELSNLEYVSHITNVNHGTNICRHSRKHRKAILQFSEKGEYIKEFSSTLDAEKETGIWHNNISKVCKGKAKTAGGFVWQYKELNK